MALRAARSHEVPVALASRSVLASPLPVPGEGQGEGSECLANLRTLTPTLSQDREREPGF